MADIGAMADWTARLIAAAGAERAALVGHGMGALVRSRRRAAIRTEVASMALLGAAAEVTVHPDLLAAAKLNSHVAIDIGEPVGLGAPAALGGAKAPGLLDARRRRAPAGKSRAGRSPCGPHHVQLLRDGSVGGGERGLRNDILILGERDQIALAPPAAARWPRSWSIPRRDRLAGGGPYVDDRMARRGLGSPEGVGGLRSIVAALAERVRRERPAFGVSTKRNRRWDPSLKFRRRFFP